MSEPMNLDDFLDSQGSAPGADKGFTATLEAVPDKPTHVKITPFQDEQGCGCSSSLELPKTMIKSVTPTGKFHFCCGKRLEVVVVEFTENAAIPIVDLMRRSPRPSDHAPGYGYGHGHQHGPMAPSYAGGEVPFPSNPATMARRRPPNGLVGRWPIPWTPCTINCIEVCTQFCHDWGWDCCQWETRCGINCGGNVIG